MKNKSEIVKNQSELENKSKNKTELVRIRENKRKAGVIEEILGVFQCNRKESGGFKINRRNKARIERIREK
jgi:hypothetical protein